MKNRKSLLKRTLIRLLALMMTVSLVPSSLCLDVSAADAEQTEQAASQTASEEEDVPESESEDDSPTMEIYKNGEAYEAEIKSGGTWPDNTVTGSYEPTSQARKVEEYNSGRLSFDVSEDLYTLTVSTGISSGSSVEYFAIRYTDVNGAPQTKYIFPTAERREMVSDYIKSLKKTVKVKKWISTTITGIKSNSPGRFAQSSSVTVEPDTAKIEEAKGQFAYITSVVDNYVDKNQEVTGSKLLDDLRESHNDLRDLGYSVNENTDSDTILSPWSIDEFLFKTDTAIKTVNSIDVFMSNGRWTVQGMAVSRVTSIGGYGEYGFYSGKYFHALGKQRICELQSKKSGTQTFNAAGDTLINIGGSGSSYFGLRQVDGTTSSAMPYNDLYSFRIDFSDVPDGGIETLLRSSASVSDPAAGPIAEHLALEVSYKDQNGWTRSFTIPVLLSVLGQYKQSGDTVRTMGLAQRGEALAFTACLPEYSSLISTRLLVGKAARDALKTEGGIEPIGSNRNRDRLITALDADYIRVAGISMYKGTCRMSNTPDGEDSVTKAVLKSYTYTFAFSEDAPLLYNTINTSEGIRINAGASDTFKLIAYNKNAPLIGAEYSGNVLIRLKTDSLIGAEPSGSTKVRLTYQDTSGSEMTSPYYNISDEVMDYIGAWPSSAGTGDNFAYKYSVQAGNIVEFPVKLADVSAITSVELSVGADSDDWQVAGISVAVANDIGRRRIYAQDMTSGDVSTTYRIVRSMNTTVIPPFPINLKLLVTTGDSFSFNTGEGTVVTARELDFNTVRYSMSYEQTKENLGYARIRRTYDINVKVADDPDAGNFNGDAGSSNHFYFQLRFASGSSAFVLANQQLSSDAFRAGCNEMFSISVNRDYGEVTALRVIPEDVSEDSDVFDKLNVEQITVTERTTGGSADQYVFDNIGWIGIDYNDKSQDAAVKARTGRTVNEISRKYKVSYKQKVINLLCEIKTLPWESDYLDVEGSVSCDLNYIDTDGQPRTMGFDVISRMASYMNKTARAYDSGTKGGSSSYANLGTVSDPNWMLRPNHSDRFILPSLVNVKSITSMTFHAVSRNNKPSKWIIGGITVSRIKSNSGVVTLSTNNNSKDGEYVRAMQTIPLCEMIKRGGKEYEELFLPAGEPQKLTVYFSDNTITWSESSSWASSVSKFPESTNDTLNLFVFPSSHSRNIEGVNVSAAVQYNISNSKLMQAKQGVLNISGSGTEDAMFSYIGLSASDMKNISSLSLQCRNAKVAFDHAIVQQVRDDVVVMTYTFDFGGASATLGLKALPMSYTKVYTPMKQTLMLSFGPDTSEMALFGMTEDNLNPNDIAVCLKYRSSLDLTSEYYSPYVYLTESGVSKIYPGMMAEFTFNVPYLSEITGYRVISFGNITASVEAAFGINYSRSGQDPDAVKLESVYSFNQKYETGNITRELEAVDKNESENGVLPLDIYFTTAQSDESTESGINVPVKAVFSYVDSKNTPHTKTFKDIRQYIQSDSKQFKTGERTLVRLFLPKCSVLNSIRLIPSEGSWKIDNLEISSLGEEIVNRRINTLFDEEGQYVTLKKVGLSTSVTADDKYKGKVDGHEKNIKLDGGKIVSGTVIISNSDEGFDLSVDMLTNGILTDITEEYSSRNDTAFAVSIPVNEGSVPMTYTITVWAVENPGVKDVINVTVPAAGQKYVPSGSSTGQDTSSSSEGGSSSEEEPPDENEEEDSGGGTEETAPPDEGQVTDEPAQTEEEQQPEEG